MANTVVGPCNFVAAQMVLALTAPNCSCTTDSVVSANIPSVDMAQPPRLSSASWHYSHSTPTDSDRHLGGRLEE